MNTYDTFGHEQNNDYAMMLMTGEEEMVTSEGNDE